MNLWHNVTVLPIVHYRKYSRRSHTNFRVLNYSWKCEALFRNSKTSRWTVKTEAELATQDIRTCSLPRCAWTSHRWQTLISENFNSQVIYQDLQTQKIW